MSGSITLARAPPGKHDPPHDEQQQQQCARGFQQNHPHAQSLSCPADAAFAVDSRSARRLHGGAAGAHDPAADYRSAAPVDQRHRRTRHHHHPEHRARPGALGGVGVDRPAWMERRPALRTLARLAARLRQTCPRLGRAVRAGPHRRGIRQLVQRRRHPRLAREAPAAVPRGSARWRGRRPDHRLLRAARRSLAHAAQRLSPRLACAARRSGQPRALLEPPAARLASRRSGQPARP